MQLTRSNSFKAICNRIFCNRDTYITDTGCKFTMKRGTGVVDVTNGKINISNAKNLKILDSVSDDIIAVNSSSIKSADFSFGRDLVLFKNCAFKNKTMFSDASRIYTSSSTPNSSTKIIIDGDFNGDMKLAGCHNVPAGYSKHAVKKDELVITGNNYGNITTGCLNKLTINGQDKGTIYSDGKMNALINGIRCVIDGFSKAWRNVPRGCY